MESRCGLPCWLDPLEGTLKVLLLFLLLCLRFFSGCFVPVFLFKAAADHRGTNFAGRYTLLAILELGCVAGSVLLAFAVVAAKWLLIGRLRPGVAYANTCSFRLRRWLFRRFVVIIDKLFLLILSFYSPLGPLWIRAVGGRVGANTLVSHACMAMDYDMQDLRGKRGVIAKVFLATSTTSPDKRTVTFHRTLIGDDCWVGIWASMPAGLTMEPGSGVAPLADVKEEIIMSGTYILGRGAVVRSGEGKTGAVSTNGTK
eukprot:jgi/Mesvir1/20244/Mv13478-RA.1